MLKPINVKCSYCNKESESILSNINAKDVYPKTGYRAIITKSENELKWICLDCFKKIISK